MLITELPSDIIAHIAKHLPYYNCVSLKIIFKDIPNFAWLFENSSLFANQKSILKRALIYHKINETHLYEILRNSSLNCKNACDLLYALNQYQITSENKYDYTLGYSDRGNMNYTTKVIQIILTTIDYHIHSTTNIINNPYYYTHTYINDVLINYYTSLITKKYYVIKDANRYSTKFRLIMYSNMWYKSNVNIFVLFSLYLMNLGVISNAPINDIMETGENVYHQNVATDYAISFIFEILELFNVNDYLAAAMILVSTYIVKYNLKFILWEQELTYNYLYDSLHNSRNVSDKFKEQLSECPVLM